MMQFFRLINMAEIKCGGNILYLYPNKVIMLDL